MTRLAPLLACLLALACAAPERGAPPPPADAAPPAATADRADAARFAELPAPDLREVIGHSVGGRPLFVHAFDGDGPTVLLLATLHGDEGAGTPLLERLVEVLRADPAAAAGRRVFVLPVANPDGYDARRRGNARDVDLNRNFPSDNARASVGGTPLSEPESRALHDLLLELEPALVVSIHQPVAVVDWDGPAEAIARAMAELCGLPARRLGSRPGSLGSFLGADRGVPVITLELPRGAQRLSADALWARYGEALLLAVRSAGSGTAN